MKAVILAGGKATRLRPLTLVTNKHLLPLYDKPVIFYAIENLVRSGVEKIMIVSSPHHLDDFVQLLGSGERFKTKAGRQIQIVYAIQNEPRGIAEGLWIARDYVGNDPCVLYLGDNIILDDLSPHIRGFTGGAKVFLKEVDDPKRFGVARVDARGTVTSIEEKPKRPKSNLAVVGVYLFDNTVFDKMIGQPLSARGEYEITYVTNLYLKEGTLAAARLKKPWFDVGTIESLFTASAYMRSKRKK
jgi:glucose-1-phosphate thymidylyltransferase